MRQDFDFDNKLNEVQQDIPGLSLVPRETNDDTIDYLKQFKEYWNFEKKFKYNSTFDTTFKKVTKEIGLNDKQMIDVMKDLIGTVIGDAAREIGLEWHLINNGEYLFGFYPKDTPEGCFAVPVLLVPYDFKFSAVKDKLLDWFADQKRGNKKKPKLQIVESNLGLNKHIQKKFNDKDAVSNVGTIDEESFNTIVKRYISDNDLHEIDVEDPGLMTFIQYASLRDNDGHMLWFFPLFIYNDENTDDSASFALCFWTDGERIKMEIYEMTWDPTYRAMAISLESEDVVKMLGTDDATVDNLNRIFKLLDLMRADIGHAAMLSYDNKRVLDACHKEPIAVIYKIKGEEARKLLDFLCSTSQSLIDEESAESEGVLVESVDFDKHL